MNHSNSLHKPFFWTSLLALVMLALAACSPSAGYSSSGSGAAAPTVAPTMAPAAMNTSAPAPTATTAAAAIPATGGSAVLNVATDPKLGKFLVDGKGMTLYMFKKDAPDKSNCTGGCLKAWPPFTASGSVTAGAGVDQSMIGTAALADGSKIVTYNHMPLYFFAKDQKPGDVTGQDVGKVWFVVSPDGKVVGDMATSSASTPQATTMAATSGVVVNVATDPKLGKILVDGKGMTLYMFKKDTPDTSNCTGGCMKAWPPFVASSAPKAGDGVNQSLLGTATLADGSKIVTYNHMPLYYWAGDTQPGDTSGQGVQNVWFVVSPDGKPVGDTSSVTPKY